MLLRSGHQAPGSALASHSEDTSSETCIPYTDTTETPESASDIRRSGSFPNGGLSCNVCGRNLDEEPTIIRCDSKSCKLLFHPSCLGNSAPLCNELWFCSLCQDSVVIEPAANHQNNVSTIPTDDVCSVCLRQVEDSDSGLQCDLCDTWKHSKCLGISDDNYDSLINSAEDFFCPACSVSGFCGICEQLIDKNLAATQIICCRSSCGRKFHAACVDQSDTSYGNSLYWECSSCHIQPHIPSYVVNHEDLERVKWHSLQGKVLFDTINDTYKEVIRWRRNLFKVPTGKAGQEFVAELTNCLKHFSTGTSLQPIALKMAMIIFPLLLQKPSRKSKSKDHTNYLSKRLELWKAGNLLAIVHEGKEIRNGLYHPNITLLITLTRSLRS